ncbi:MAG: NifB/NifX family molybdenum-iron cluster-binding protein, partial [Pirellulales bacterium]|nr:NifB/NifX family molybdenum-iron cluster-binding protein [Pirellulales bacterium]
MKIAITATGADLEARVDPRFGRCPFFLIVETEDLSFEAIDNGNAALGSGAGIQSAQLIAEKGVTHVLTGNCGPNAHQTLSAAGIGVIVGCSGTVRDVIGQYSTGQFHAASEPNVASHFGMGASSAAGSPMGSGMGGMGGGGG